MNQQKPRRQFLKQTLVAGAGIAALPLNKVVAAHHEALSGRFKLSLAEWSLRDWIRSGKDQQS